MATQKLVGSVVLCQQKLPLSAWISPVDPDSTTAGGRSVQG
jgi:hypothetical protein